MGEGSSVRRAFSIVTLLVLATGSFLGTWTTVFLLVAAAGGPAVNAAWGATGLLVLTGAVVGLSSGASLTVRIATYQLATVALFFAFLLAVAVTTFVLLTLVVDSAPVGLLAAVVAVLGTAAVGGLLLLVGVWGADTGEDWALFVRMVAASLALGLLTIGALGVTWIVSLFGTVIAGGIAGLDLGVQGTAIATTLLTAAVAVAIVRRELRAVHTVEGRANARVVDPSEAPHLHAVVNRMAAQLDVPPPTVAVSETAVPEAMIVGYRPGSMHLVLSTGAITALDDDELIAVVAHELGHVANRDAIVMTALSVPALIARGFRPGTSQDASDGPDGVVALLGWLVFTPPLVVSQAIVASLAREREVAADRVAVETLGTGATLASALQSLETAIHDSPRSDLRAAADVSALSILPFDPFTATGDSATLDSHFKRWLLGTHPPTGRRIDRLRAYESERRGE